MQCGEDGEVLPTKPPVTEKERYQQQNFPNAADNLPFVHSPPSSPHPLVRHLYPLHRVGLGFDKGVVDALWFRVCESPEKRESLWRGFIEKRILIPHSEGRWKVNGDMIDYTKIHTFGEEWGEYYYYFTKEVVRLNTMAQSTLVLQAFSGFDDIKGHVHFIFNLWLDPSSTPPLPPDCLVRCSRLLAGNTMDVLENRMSGGKILKLLEAIAENCDASEPESYVKAQVDYLIQLDRYVYFLDT